MWHRWQSIGSFATSIRSLLDPCGSWQVLQASRTGAWSHRNGPRFSVWQLTHVSFTQFPTLSMRTLVAPWGLWQDAQSILPSRKGMWPERWSLETSVLWHVPQVSMTVAVFSCACGDFGLWTEWHVTHDRFRASCMLPFQ